MLNFLLALAQPAADAAAAVAPAAEPVKAGAIQFDWMTITEGVFRWGHVVAGILWLGHLYFFNFVNAQVAKTYDADSKKKVVPELMPRALYWFRWGAAWTWLTGITLLGLVFYMTSQRGELSAGMASGAGFGVLVLGFVLYDVMWKALAKSEMLGMVLSFVLTVGVAAMLGQLGFPSRMVLIHIGAMFGTIMAANVWMRIWPNQRRIIGAIRDGNAPDAAWAGMAGLRSKHNTYMSAPLIFFMLNYHMQGFPMVNKPFVMVAIWVAVGWTLIWLLYKKSGCDNTKAY